VGGGAMKAMSSMRSFTKGGSFVKPERKHTWYRKNRNCRPTLTIEASSRITLYETFVYKWTLLQIKSICRLSPGGCVHMWAPMYYILEWMLVSLILHFYGTCITMAAIFRYFCVYYVFKVIAFGNFQENKVIFIYLL